MTKNWVLAAALLSLAVSISCSSAHSPTPPISVDVSSQFADLFVGEANVQITATVTGSANTAVTWSLQQNGTDCTNNPSVCGSLSSTTANPVNYTAPPTPQTVTVVATLQSNTAQSGSVDLKISAISVQVTPYNTNIGVGLGQQFTAVVLPDQAPQTVTWSIANCSGACGSIDANGLYTAPGSAGGTFNVQASAAAPLSGSGSVPAKVVSSRMPAGTYTFQTTGYDIHTTLAVAAAGTLTVTGGGAVSGAWEDLTSAGPQSCTFSGGSFTADSNNQGKLTLPSSCDANPRIYNVVLDAAGDIQMIEADGIATGSGVIEPFTGTFTGLSSLKGNFVFGFTGTNYITGARTGYAGLVTMDGAGGISAPGLLDKNEGGTAGSDSTVTGSYKFVSNGIYTMQLISSLGTFNFKLFGVSGTNKAGTPAILYAISTDPVAQNPGVSGTVVFQDPKIQSDPSNDELNKISIVALTGADKGGSNVSLSLISPDKKGNLFGNFDQNDAGTVQSVSSFNNTYNQSGNGRYIINLLGNASGSPTGIPFVLYLSAANTGFLLDQKSASVITGTMVTQLLQTKDLVQFAPSELPSTYAAATTTCAVADTTGSPQCALVANLLLTWAANGSCTARCVSGTEWFGATPIGTGIALGGGKNDTYTLSQSGNGGTGSGGSSIVLTTPSNQTFVIYMLDVFDNLQPTKDTSHFLMFDLDNGVTNASIINVQQ